MDISAVKLELIEMLLHTEKNAVLEKVRQILVSQDEDKTAGYSIVGEPLNVEEYNQKLQKSEEDLKESKVISQEDLKKKFNIKK